MYATTKGWPGAENYLNALFFNKILPREVASLAPAQLEVLCYEYLRYKDLLNSLILPIGRSLPDIDIYGINKSGEKILAQVTQSHNKKVIERKLDVLKNYQSLNSKLIFFGPKEMLQEDSLVAYKTIEQVFSLMNENYPEMINTMIGN
jgi:hypothetical protein